MPVILSLEGESRRFTSSGLQAHLNYTVRCKLKSNQTKITNLKSKAKQNQTKSTTKKQNKIKTQK